MPPHQLLHKYQIPKLSLFFATYPFQDDKIKSAVEAVYSYYLFSYYQMLEFTETTRKFYAEDHEKLTNADVMYYLRRSWSFAYGMYALLRTTLELMSMIRKNMLNHKGPIEAYYESGIKRLVDIANDIVKHPKGQNSHYAASPISLEIGGMIEVVTYSDYQPQKIGLDPEADFVLVHDYLEYISDLLLSLKEGY